MDNKCTTAFNIEIGKQLVFDEVEKITSYHLSKISQQDYDDKRFTQPDAESLNMSWHKASDLLALIFARYIHCQYYGVNDNFVMEICVSGCFRKSLVPSIRSLAFTLAVNVLLRDWYLIIGDTDDATLKAQEIEESTSEVRTLLAMRVSRVRLKAHPFP